MSAYDAWKTTDPAIEAECPDCGTDLRFDTCEHVVEPDLEQMALDLDVE